MIAGYIYGVALNDRPELERMAAAFASPPYKAPPKSPVLYIKPRNCLMAGDDGITLDPDLSTVEVAATLGLHFGRDASRVTAGKALEYVAAASIALDVSEVNDSYYRPPFRQRCRDGFLPLGRPAAFTGGLLESEIETRINGRVVHRWSLTRLERSAAALIAEMSRFMTLAAGDLLLIGLPSDAPRVGPGDRIKVLCPGLPSLTVAIAPRTGL